MQCPDCGYMLTAFDAECLRCKNFPPKSRPAPDALPSVEQSPQTPDAAVIGPLPEHPAAIKYRRTARVLNTLAFGFVALVGLAVLWGFYSGSSERQQARETISAQQEALAEGRQPCASADEQGCLIAIHKLQSLGDQEDARFLANTGIVSLYLDEISMPGASRELRQTGHLSSRSANDVADFAALTGNRTAMNAAGYLYEHEKARGN